MARDGRKAFEVIWRIENITPWLQTKDDSLYSPSFLAKSIRNTRWKLKLTRICLQAENCISLTLQRYIDDCSESIALNYELSFLACDESPLKSKTYTTKFVPKTVSQQLILTGVEILEKKEAYLPKGVLTVCCKLWMPLSWTSKGSQCSIRSLIGRKCITLDGTIDYFSRFGRDSNVTVNFLSPSEEICSISFDVSRPQSRFGLWFERTELQCKCFSSYSCKLFALTSERGRAECVSSICLATLLTSRKTCVFEIHFNHVHLNSPSYLINDALTLQLEITYYPGVESEYIQYDDNNYKELTDESPDLENVNSSNLEIEHSNKIYCPHLSEHEEKPGDIEENESSDEGEGFGAAAERKLLLTTLKKDLTSLYNDRLFCDTNLRTDTETIPAHRSVLCARSPVFKKMFMTDMKEKAGECINIPDISPDTVRRMLKFLYTDSVGDLEMQSAKDLYIASDKYDIVSLKHNCSCFIKKNLCPANVCDVLVLADMHQDKDLESAAQEYVLTNDEEVFYSDEWKLFMKNCGCLAAQVMYLKCTKK